MNLLLADDHPLFVDGLRNLLGGRGLNVVGTARDGLEALEMARRLHPDVILMDINMPGCDGLAATRLIKAELPEIKIVMLTMSGNDDDVFEAIKSGACGYLLKTEDTEDFFSRLKELAEGEAPLSPGLAARILEQFGREVSAAPQHQDSTSSEPLTERELEVLTLVAQGLTYKAVAAKLYLTERTIKYHMGEIVARLQLRNRKQVVEYARRSGLVSPKPRSS
ncbi:MAG: response regulator transcription factor [Chloroflexi bacterium]|nr:response regulator transcription factor [Chloroflexota bacterium]